MWECLEQVRKKLRNDLKVPSDFQTLEDVLKSIRDYPKIVDRDRQEQRFSNAYECFDGLKQLTDLLPNAKAVHNESWDCLSEIFASNAEGDIEILEGAADDYGKLREDKTLLKKELGALLKNDKLSRNGQKVLEKMISKYGAHFDRRYKELIEQLSKDKKGLKRP